MARRRYRQTGIMALLTGAAVFIVLIVVVIWVFQSHGPIEEHEEMTHEAFVTTVGEYAVAEYAKSGVLPSVVTAQAALESDYGTSDLSKDYNNLFGYKASRGERSVRLPTQEFQDGEWQTIEDDFKVYRNWRQSVKDHGRLMQHGVSWDHDLYQGVIDAKDYKEAAQALVDAGYATDLDYAEKIIDTIQTYQLDQLDEEVK